MKPAELEKAILEYTLPASVLAKPGNAFFIARSVLTALRLFCTLPFRGVRALFPGNSTSIPRFDLERAAIAYSLTESLLRSPFFPFRRTCLRRSLLLTHLFRRCGVMVSAAFGIDPAESGWEGHSWLVLDDHPFLEAEEEERAFVPMFRLPDDGRGKGERRDRGNPPGA